MRILILSQYWYPENGVPQRRWSWLSSVLEDAGHEVLVIAPPPHYERKIPLREWLGRKKFRSVNQVDSGPSGERIVRSGYLPAGMSITHRALNQASVALSQVWVALRRRGPLLDFNPDLIIGTVPALPTAMVTAVVAKRFRTSYVIDLRDAWPDLLGQSKEWNKATGRRSIRERVLSKGPIQLLSRVVKFLVNQILRRADGIMVTSSRLGRDLRGRPELQRQGRLPRIAVVRNVFPPETDYIAKSKQNRAHDALNVLYAGTLGRAQHLANAVYAAQIARESGIDVQLWFVGAGATRETLTETCREIGVPAKFMPRRPADQLDELYDWADTALVHLTDWGPLDQAVPSKTYELMATSVHISAVVRGEAAELIEKFHAGHVVTPEDPQALAELWINLAIHRERLAVSNAGRDWVQNEHKDTAPQAFLKLIKEVSK